MRQRGVVDVGGVDFVAAITDQAQAALAGALGAPLNLANNLTADTVPRWTRVIDCRMTACGTSYACSSRAALNWTGAAHTRVLAAIAVPLTIAGNQRRFCASDP